MNRKRIKKTTRILFRKIKTQVKYFSARFNAAAVHQFRVEYKRLRTLSTMLASNEQHHQKSNPLKKLKRIYGLLGDIRELQLQQQYIAVAVKNPRKKLQAYFKSLQTEIVRLKKILAMLPVKKIVAHSKTALIHQLPRHFGSAKYKMFLKTKSAAVATLIETGSYSDKNIHALRKALKDLYYMLKLFRKYQIVADATRANETEKYYDQLLNEMGLFHDKCAAIALLHPRRLKQLDNDTRLSLQQIKIEWSKQKQQMKKELQHQLSAGAVLLK